MKIFNFDFSFKRDCLKYRHIFAVFFLLEIYLSPALAHEKPLGSPIKCASGELQNGKHVCKAPEGFPKKPEEIHRNHAPKPAHQHSREELTLIETRELGQDRMKLWATSDGNLQVDFQSKEGNDSFEIDSEDFGQSGSLNLPLLSFSGGKQGLVVLNLVEINTETGKAFLDNGTFHEVSPAALEIPLIKLPGSTTDSWNASVVGKQSMGVVDIKDGQSAKPTLSRSTLTAVLAKTYGAVKVSGEAELGVDTGRGQSEKVASFGLSVSVKGFYCCAKVEQAIKEDSEAEPQFVFGHTKHF